MIVFEYFIEKMEVFRLRMDKLKPTRNPETQKPSPNPITRSLLLAISVCYHARLQDRVGYEEGVTAQFVAPLGLPGGAAQFRNEIQWYPTILTHHFTCSVYLTILPSQLPGSTAGQHDPWSKHCQECCPQRECLHDDNLH